MLHVEHHLVLRPRQERAPRSADCGTAAGGGGAGVRQGGVGKGCAQGADRGAMPPHRYSCLLTPHPSHSVLTGIVADAPVGVDHRAAGNGGTGQLHAAAVGAGAGRGREEPSRWWSTIASTCGRTTMTIASLRTRNPPLAPPHLDDVVALLLGQEVVVQVGARLPADELHPGPLGIRGGGAATAAVQAAGVAGRHPGRLCRQHQAGQQQDEHLLSCPHAAAEHCTRRRVAACPLV